VIHSFGRVAYLAPVLPWRVRKVMSYQRAVTPRTIRWAARVSRGSITWTACSHHIAAPVKHLGAWRVIYNAVPVDRFRYSPAVAADAPLVFLGRVEAIKGPHLAVQIARRAGRRLVIAGNVPDDADARAFFREHIEPHVDGTSVTYLGAVDDRQKSDLLTTASALLMPILWDEPFGIVMAEALACGTPVIALSRGSVPEVIEDEVTGFVCESIEEMVAGVGRLAELSRQRCRHSAETRFSQEALVDGYESLYRRLVAADPASDRSPAREVAGA
jgi:glycosyltransferase involved in cell wall biosynthesis